MVFDNPTANAGRGLIGWRQLLIVCGILVLGLGYGLYATHSSMQQRVATLQANLDEATQELAELRSSREVKEAEIASNLEVITRRLGVTAGDVEKARQQLAQRMKQQQESMEQKLADELAAKASSTDVATLRQEAVSKLAEVQQDANTKYGNVSGEVTVLKQDIASARQDLSRELVDVKTALSDGIARNAGELAQLRLRGERNYIDLDLRKNKKTPFQPVGDIRISLTNTDPKRQKYSIMLMVDDNRLEKKDRTANEPVQFLVGRDHLRYELVVYTVTKDQIRGYISMPKDKVLSAEGPTAARP